MQLDLKLGALALATLGMAHASEPVAPVLQQLEVRAERLTAEEERQQSATGKVVVTRDELERLDAATIGEILRQLPGVSLSTDADGRRGRAQAPDRLEPRIVVDGSPLPGGNRPALRLPVELIERIEIIRNSTPEFPSGPGGTVNLILRDTVAKKTGTFRVGLMHDGESFGGRAGGMYGDREGQSGVIAMGFVDSRPQNSERDLSRESFSAGARNGWLLESETERGDDAGLHTFMRVTRNLGQGERLVVTPMLMARRQSSDTSMQQQSYADPLNGSGLAPSGSEREARDGDRLTGRLSLDWKKRRPGQGESGVVAVIQATWEQTDRTGLDFDAGGTLLTRTDTEDSRRVQDWSVKARHGLVVAEAHVITLGLDAGYRQSRDRRKQSVNNIPQALGGQARVQGSEQEYALWAQDEWQLAEDHVLTPGWRLQYGVREVTDGLGVTVRDDGLSALPSLHYLWAFRPQWNLRLSLAGSEKTPGLTDLTPVVMLANGNNTASNPDRGGNPSLQPERAWTAQIGLEHFLSERRGSAGINLYLRRIEDKIVRRTALEGARYVERPFNLARAEEISLVADFKWKAPTLPALTLRGNAAYDRSRWEDALFIPVRDEKPRKSANLGFDYEWKQKRFNFGATLSHQSDLTRETSPASFKSQQPRTQLDLYAARKLDRTLTLRLGVDNLLRTGRAEEALQYAGGQVTQRERQDGKGRHLVNLSLEGKW